jgi:hypothetical protein
MAVSRVAVRKKAKGLISETWQSQANLAFFLALLILIAFVLPSLGFGREDTARYSNIGFTILLISGVAIAWGSRKLLWLVASIAAISMVVRWIAHFKHDTIWSIRSDWWTVAAIVGIAYVLLTQIFRPGRVTHYRLEGAIAIYLLFGVAWAHGYHIVSQTIPGSFAGPAGEVASASSWEYFSFVTLTTVGYGDITPVHQVARTLAVGEALAGQLYLAVLIARLVAMELVFWQKKIESGDY